MDTINEICRQAMDRLNLSYRTISDASGLSESTVRNFMTDKSKQPSVYTTGPICKVLAISLDKFFEIPKLQPKPEKDYQDMINGLNVEMVHQEEKNLIQAKQIKVLSFLSGGLLTLCILLAAALIRCLT